MPGDLAVGEGVDHLLEQLVALVAAAVAEHRDPAPGRLGGGRQQSGVGHAVGAHHQAGPQFGEGGQEHLACRGRRRDQQVGAAQQAAVGVAPFGHQAAGQAPGLVLAARAGRPVAQAGAGGAGGGVEQLRSGAEGEVVVQGPGDREVTPGGGLEQGPHHGQGSPHGVLQVHQVHSGVEQAADPGSGIGRGPGIEGEGEQGLTVRPPLHGSSAGVVEAEHDWVDVVSQGGDEVAQVQLGAADDPRPQPVMHQVQHPAALRRLGAAEQFEAETGLHSPQWVALG